MAGEKKQSSSELSTILTQSQTLEEKSINQIMQLIKKGTSLSELEVNEQYGKEQMTLVMLAAKSLDVEALKKLLETRFSQEINFRNDSSTPLFLAIDTTLQKTFIGEKFDLQTIRCLLENKAKKNLQISDKNALDHFFDSYINTAWTGIPPISLKELKEIIGLLKTEESTIKNGKDSVQLAFESGYFHLATAILEVDKSTQQHLNYENIAENIESIVKNAEVNKDIDMLNLWINLLYEKSETTITLSDFQGTTPQRPTSPPETKEKTVVAEKIPHDVAQFVQRAAEDNWNPIKKWAENVSKKAHTHTRAKKINNIPTKLPPSTPTHSQFSWGNFSKTFSNFWKPSTSSSRSLSFGTPSKLLHTKDSRDNNSTIIHVRGLNK